MATKIWLPTFDPSWELVACRPMEVAGYGFLQAGDTVPKQFFTARRLRQMYEIRHVEPAVNPIPKRKSRGQQYEARGAGSRWSVYLGDQLIDGPFVKNKADRIVAQLNEGSDEHPEAA